MKKFADLHAEIEADAVRELMRRRQMWASCPSDDGHALKPDAQIVPLATINAAITELIEWRRKAGVPGANDLYEAFYDL